ncbi:MAG: FAD-dependent monooxygenase [Thiolinea sp.]
MQQHLNGFKPGNLQIAESVRGLTTPDPMVDLPEKIDVLIVGCGPAGLTLARQLAEFADIKTCIVDQKSGPMLFGQADGISCRTIEIMEAYNCSETVVKESYWLNQNAFWQPDTANPQHIKRAHKVKDARIGLSEFRHSVVNQARIHDLLLEGMKHSPARLIPHYNRRLRELIIDSALSQDLCQYPITAAFERIDDEQNIKVETLNARFVVGCDGARSTVRNSLSIPLTGDSANKAWGVMDVLVDSNFPDLRVKSFIQSKDHGAVMIVPREGGYLVRVYVELELLARGQRIAQLELGVDDIIAAAQRVMHPYTFEVKEVAWWSRYEIGQRVADRFDDTPVDNPDHLFPRAFVAGDACHTHSPKAGLGLNVSVHDSFNLGWKLAAVIRGQHHPAILHTYSSERRNIANELIALDKKMSSLVATRPSQKKDGVKTDTGDIQKYITKQNGFIAGTTIEYGSSIIRSTAGHQALATGFPVGRRFHSAMAIRLADGRPLHIGHLIKADGRWRIFIFGDERKPDDPASKVCQLIQFLTASTASPLRKYSPEGADIDSVIDVYGVFQQQDLAIETMPALLWPQKGKYGLRDYEKVFHAETGNDIFELRGINRTSGCMVIVRPDQHVADILPLTAHDELAAFFDGFMLAQP